LTHPRISIRKTAVSSVGPSGGPQTAEQTITCEGVGQVLEAVGTSPHGHENCSNQNDSVSCNNLYPTVIRNFTTDPKALANVYLRAGF